SFLPVYPPRCLNLLEARLVASLLATRNRKSSGAAQCVTTSLPPSDGCRTVYAWLPRARSSSLSRAATRASRRFPLRLRRLAADRAAGARAAARAPRRRGGVARLPCAAARRPGRGRLRRLALLPHRHVQGPLRGAAARRVLSRPARPGARSPVRHLPPALLDE